MGRPARRLITEPHDTDKEIPVTASPIQVNGTKRPSLPIFGDWQPIARDGNATVWEKSVAPVPVPAPDEPAPTAPATNPIAEAEAEAIRARTEAEKAKAAAEIAAIQTKAEADRQRAELASKKAAAKAEAEIALAEAETARVIAQAKAEREAREAAAKAEAEATKKREKSAGSWRNAALGFAVVCAVVALPVQMSAFWSPKAPWLLIAPLVLEGGAWVVLRGAAAAVDDHRPHWHYRLIAWSLAFIAAGINLSHGLSHFDVATAGGTAFASLAGPGVWDLHEHGRIRVRDGKLTRSERRARKAAEKRAAAERRAADEAARSAVEKLAADREKAFPDVWEHAKNLAAALGETAVSETTWRRAWFDKHGAEPGEELDVVRDRRTAVMRMEKALGEAPANTPSKVPNAQRGIQMKTPVKGSSYKPVPPRRTTGDTRRYHPLARAAAAETKRKSNAAKTANPDAN